MSLLMTKKRLLRALEVRKAVSEKEKYSPREKLLFYRKKSIGKTSHASVLDLGTVAFRINR